MSKRPLPAPLGRLDRAAPGPRSRPLLQSSATVRRHALAWTLLLGLPPAGFAAGGPGAGGKELAFDEAKGNCLACHSMPTLPDAQRPGNIGPPLIAMGARFPDRAKLRAQIWDPTVANPRSLMPPYGKHQILDEAELDRIVDFVLGL